VTATATFAPPEHSVTARTSSFSFKGSKVDIPTVGRKLNVGSVLEGNVRKHGDQLRITVDLVDARTGYPVWSDSYDRDLKDVFAVQSEIAQSVGRAMQVRLLGADRQLLTSGGTQDPVALDSYLRGREAGAAEDEGGLQRAIDHFDAAIRQDPGYALAYSAKALALGQYASDFVGDRKERERLIAMSVVMADRAVQLAPSSGQVYGVLSTVLANSTLDSAAIEKTAARAIQLEPGNADNYARYANIARSLGRKDALAASERAVALNPLSVKQQQEHAFTLAYLRRFDAAREAMLRSFALGDLWLGHVRLGLIEVAAGNPQSALPQCEPYRKTWVAQMCLALAYHLLHRDIDAQKALREMHASQGDGLAYQYAEIAAQWGDDKAALGWLNKAFGLRDAGLLDIKVDPFLDPIRNEPQFKQIVEQLRFPA
jgi:tetratricopeptide (TPR) repeat protein